MPIQPEERLTPLRELQLVKAHQRGDPDAIGELLEAYQRRIYSICFRMVRDEHQVRDLTQEAVLKVLQGLESYDGRSKLSTWVIRVAMNCCLSHLRKQRVRRHGSLDAVTAEGGLAASSGVAGAELSPPGHVELAEMRSVLGRALAGLDHQMRAVIVLRDMQDLEYLRIADVLKIPVGTVKSRLFRARLALRNAVETELGRDEAGDEPINEVG